MLAQSIVSTGFTLTSPCATRFVKVSPPHFSQGFRLLCSKVPKASMPKAYVPRTSVNKMPKARVPKAEGWTGPVPTAKVPKAPVVHTKPSSVPKEEVTSDNLDETIHTREYPNGDVYVGQLADNKHHGKGVITYAHGASWKGEFLRGRQHNGHGYSVVDVKSGLGWSKGYYEGPLEAGIRQGTGKMCFEDGSWWEGLFHNGSGVTGKGYVPADEGLVECVEKVDGKVVSRTLIPADAS